MPIFVDGRQHRDRERILAFNIDAFGNSVLYYGDETAHAHRVEAVAAETEA